MIIINKNAVILVLSLTALVSAAIWRTLDKESEKSTVIVVHNPQGIEEKITTVSSECITSVITEKITDMQTTSLLSETTVISSTLTTVVSELKQPVTEEILYLDINSAGFDDLVKLKGIGEHLAEQIIAYREEYGGFSNIEELMNVSGIGEKIFSSICDYVYVENPVYYSETEAAEEIEVIDETAELPAEPAETETTAPALTLEEIAPINLNEADIETLILLPYVDENIAEEIIIFRENLKSFENTYEILYIEDLTQEQWSEVLKFVCV